MLKHAEIDPETNTVVRVIVSGSKRWCETNLGGVWIRVPKTKVGKGYIYYPDTGKFGPPSPYPSWTLDDQYQWTPPFLAQMVKARTCGMRRLNLGRK